MEFEGFSQEALQFFLDLRFHNEKAWFEEHKSVYLEKVKSPMEALHRDLLPFMQDLDPRLDLKTQRVVSRIYRDARYARGVPYRDHMWMSYKPVGKSNSEAFTYFIYLTPDEWGFGAGFYAYVPELMESFRRELLKRGDVFLRYLEAPGMEQFEIYGDSLKRAAKNDLPKEIAPWYNKKNFGFECVRPIGPEVFSGEMVSVIREGFQTLYPVYCFVTGLSDPQTF